MLFHEDRVSTPHQRFRLVLEQAAAESSYLLSRVDCFAMQIANKRMLDMRIASDRVYLYGLPWQYQFYLQEMVLYPAYAKFAQHLNHWRAGHYQVVDRRALDSFDDDLEGVSLNSVSNEVSVGLTLTPLYDLLELSSRLLRSRHVSLGC